MTTGINCMRSFGMAIAILTVHGCAAWHEGVRHSTASSVIGGNLSTCSKPGMAMTGFTRDGHCQDLGDDDAGSHHICIEMKSDFCRVTGQPDWCSKKMRCMGRPGNCPIGNWCVCQWAFARYMQMAGGCDSIVELVCDATNLAALRAYEQSSSQVHKEALACIKKRCGLSHKSRF
jgi:uncharacterized protein (DUF2237 family)